MLSICIPAYNYPVDKLVTALHGQCQQLSAYEIIIADDASSDIALCKYDAIEHLSGVTIIRNSNNMGRSAIRNMLAEQAQFERLLFLDCDAEIVNPRFIANYITAAHNAEVVCGGTGYSVTMPANKAERFRWYYGKAREQRSAEQRNVHMHQSFSSFNFLISKAVFLSIRFDESIVNYGHEDTLFGVVLEQKNVPVLHIDNVALHAGLESGEVFLKKTRRGIETLRLLVANEKYSDLLSMKITLLRAFGKCSQWKLHGIIARIFSISQNVMQRLILRTNSIKLLDLYKLGYFCSCMKDLSDSNSDNS